jgi:hypothetical protein
MLTPLCNPTALATLELISNCFPHCDALRPNFPGKDTILATKSFEFILFGTPGLFHLNPIFKKL